MIGDYRPLHRIAVGGMSEVYRALVAQAHGGDRSVVIKRLLSSLLEDKEYRAMFEEESRLGLLIDSPNVVEVLDSGEHDGVPYLVLEYVFGVDLWQLARWLTRNRRRLDVPLAVYIATELLAGLEAVHDVRDKEGSPLLAVHRDVSPSNVFLSVHGDVKLGDLGIARPLVRENQRPTGPRSLRAKGKLGYLAPEQVAGADKIDQRADLFAAAVVTCELLMGQPLFTGGTELAILLAIRDCDLTRFERHALGLPRGLVSALRDALAKEPEERVESASKLRHRLMPFAIGARERVRGDLGALVTEVIDSGERASGSFDRTSLARTVEASDSELDPAMVDLITPPAGPSNRRPPTPDPLSVGPSYVVVVKGEELGPMPYAEVVRGIVQGRFGPTDNVGKDGDEPLPLTAHRELARHLPPSSRTPTEEQRGRLAATSETFAMSPKFGMLHILARAFLERETGLYLCEQAGVRKEVYVADGEPVYVTSNQASELLGEYLVRVGVIDRTELDLALAVMPRFEGRLGDTLTALGLVEPLLLVRHIANKVREQLLGVFEWSEGSVSFYRNAAAPESSFNLGLEPWSILEDGAGARLENAMDGGLLINAAAAGVEKVANEGDLPILPARFKAVLFSLSQPRTLEELERHAGDSTRARRFLLVLLAIGAVRICK